MYTEICTTAYEYVGTSTVLGTSTNNCYNKIDGQVSLLIYVGIFIAAYLLATKLMKKT